HPRCPLRCRRCPRRNGKANGRLRTLRSQISTLAANGSLVYVAATLRRCLSFSVAPPGRRCSFFCSGRRPRRALLECGGSTPLLRIRSLTLRHRAALDSYKFFLRLQILSFVAHPSLALIALGAVCSTH